MNDIGVQATLQALKQLEAEQEIIGYSYQGSYLTMTTYDECLIPLRVVISATERQSHHAFILVVQQQKGRLTRKRMQSLVDDVKLELCKTIDFFTTLECGHVV